MQLTAQDEDKYDDEESIRCLRSRAVDTARIRTWKAAAAGRDRHAVRNWLDTVVVATEANVLDRLLSLLEDWADAAEARPRIALDFQLQTTPPGDGGVVETTAVLSATILMGDVAVVVPFAVGAPGTEAGAGAGAGATTAAAVAACTSTLQLIRRFEALVEDNGVSKVVFDRRVAQVALALLASQRAALDPSLLARAEPAYLTMAHDACDQFQEEMGPRVAAAALRPQAQAAAGASAAATAAAAASGGDAGGEPEVIEVADSEEAEQEARIAAEEEEVEEDEDEDEDEEDGEEDEDEDEGEDEDWEEDEHLTPEEQTDMLSRMVALPGAPTLRQVVGTLEAMGLLTPHYSWLRPFAPDDEGLRDAFVLKHRRYDTLLPRLPWAPQAPASFLRWDAVEERRPCPCLVVSRTYLLRLALDMVGLAKAYVAMVGGPEAARAKELMRPVGSYRFRGALDPMSSSGGGGSNGKGSSVAAGAVGQERRRAWCVAAVRRELTQFVLTRRAVLRLDATDESNELYGILRRYLRRWQEAGARLGGATGGNLREASAAAHGGDLLDREVDLQLLHKVLEALNREERERQRAAAAAAGTRKQQQQKMKKRGTEATVEAPQLPQMTTTTTATTKERSGSAGGAGGGGGGGGGIGRLFGWFHRPAKRARSSE